MRSDLITSGMTKSERFWSKVRKTEGCWIWEGMMNRQNSGLFDGKTARTFAYVEAFGPPSMPFVHVGLNCDPRCVRPDHLTVSAGRRPRTPPEVRFWSRVDRSGGDDACWIWNGALVRSPYGLEYGLFGITEDETVLAHRFAWEITNGKIPDDKILRHVVCRTTRCVNPRHLAVGTYKDNHDDAVRDGMVKYELVHGVVEAFPVHCRRAKVKV